MPNTRKDAPILRRLISQLKQKGHNKIAARQIAVAALQKSGNLKPGSTAPTAKGRTRGLMTPGARAIDRAKKYAKKEGRPDAKYDYNPSTNRATLKRRRHAN